MTPPKFINKPSIVAEEYRGNNQSTWVLQKLTHILKESLNITTDLKVLQNICHHKKGEVVESKVSSIVLLYIYMWILIITQV